MRRLSAAVAVAAAGALALSACSTPSSDGGGDGETTAAGGDGGATTALSIGWNQSFYEYNSASATGNATANNNVLYFMNSGFNYYDGDLNLVKDESFGTYEKVSDDPLTVTYTINDDVNWSDGTPVTAADMLLYWGALSGNFNTITDADVEYDEEGNPVNPQDGVYFNFTSDSVGLVEEFPEISDDGKTITFVYTKPFGDWEINLAIGVPAHVVAMRALGIDDPAEATQALIDAFQNNDAAALGPISQFWNPASSTATPCPMTSCCTCRAAPTSWWTSSRTSTSPSSGTPTTPGTRFPRSTRSPSVTTRTRWPWSRPSRTVRST
jgi:ABC-type dipeptide transport system, periplasmic component